MSGKKGEKTIKPICLWGSNGGFKLTTYNNHAQMGTSAKEGKIILLAHKLAVANQIACLPFLLHPPLTQVVFDYPPLEFDLTPLPPIPMWVPFPQSVLSFLSTSWLKIPETILLTNVLIYILSVCLSGFQFAFGSGSWIRVVKSSPEFACIFCKTFSVLLTLDKTWWGPQLCSQGRVTTSVSQLLLVYPVISPGPDPGTK